ncbi:hypothetical protein H6P81_013425 [Aristolochia fimbriata]|uniref:Uncharacterized protein n=1 Tax=Aristolochia fimbriata TaxID=158543 RepID=A0AAV7EIA1_ARIFI|nr:hypothetical protein H6P81_013425 [Aristolochia fimbriata]
MAAGLVRRGYDVSILCLLLLIPVLVSGKAAPPGYGCISFCVLKGLKCQQECPTEDPDRIPCLTQCYNQQLECVADCRRRRHPPPTESGDGAAAGGPHA